MAPTDPVSSEPRRFAIKLPRPLWIAVATGVLVVLGMGLQLGLPVYRDHAAIREIERMGGTFQVHPRGPEWLRAWIGDYSIKLFDRLTTVYLVDSPATDTTLGWLRGLTNLERLELL